MKKLYKLFGIIVLAAVMVSFSSCVMLSAYGGAGGMHGIFTFSSPAAEESVEIGSYYVILGLADAGYKVYAQSVKEAEAAGKKITSVTKSYVVFTKTTAYAR